MSDVQRPEYIGRFNLSSEPADEDLLVEITWRYAYRGTPFWVRLRWRPGSQDVVEWAAKTRWEYFVSLAIEGPPDAVEEFTVATIAGQLSQA